MIIHLNKNNKAVQAALLFFSFIVNAQNFNNLVPNGSFEVQTNCPTNNSQLYLAIPWFLGPSTDLYDTCASIASTANVPYVGGIYYDTVYPKHGHAFIGMHLYAGREYAQVELTQTLNFGNCYFVEFYVRRSGISSHAINNIGVNISTNSYTSYPYTSPLMVPIHITAYNNPIINDSNNWVRVSGIYEPIGGEGYLAIGNMTDDLNTNSEIIHPTSPFFPTGYYFVDAVSVFSINPGGVLPWAYYDTTVILGDSVYIGNTMGGNFNPQWFTIGGSYITTNAGIYVKPAATTSYVVNYTVCGIPRADTIQVTVIDDSSVTENELRKMQFKAFPNPAKDELVIEFETDFTKPREIKMIDVLGKEVRKVLIQNKKQKINIEALSNGVYYLQLQSSNGLKITKKLVKE